MLRGVQSRLSKEVRSPVLAVRGKCCELPGLRVPIITYPNELAPAAALTQPDSGEAKETSCSN